MFTYLKIPWRRDKLSTPVFIGFPGGSDGKENTCNEGDLTRSLGWKDSLEESSCLENSMDREAWWATAHRVTKSQTRLSDKLSLSLKSLRVLFHIQDKLNT